MTRFLIECLAKLVVIGGVSFLVAYFGAYLLWMFAHAH